MKIGTFLKLGALAVAAASTAAGSVFLTTKALTKVTDKPKADEEMPSVEPAQTAAPVVEEVPAFTPAPAIEVAPAIEITPNPVVELNPEPQVPEVVEPVLEVAPVVEEVPAPVVEETPAFEPAPEEPDYTDVSMALPYLAGKINEENADIADVVITPVEQEAMANTEVVVEPEAPIVEPVAPVVEPEAPVVEPVAPVVEPVAPIETFADITPVSMNDNESVAEVPEVLPTVEDAATPITFGEITPVEEPISVDPVITEPAVPAEPVVESAPVVEEAPAPVVETPAKGKTVKIGDALVSDKTDDVAISAVSSAFNVSSDNLVSISAEGNMPMVFEFLYADMRTDATLMSVYFINPDGQAVLPPEIDRENVLAFGRNFITGNEELKAFLA